MSVVMTAAERTVFKKPHNRKLGDGIYSFSIPTGIDHCPGMTKVCDSVCYAQRGFFNYPALQRAMSDARKLTESRVFVTRAIAEIQRHAIKIVRIHVSGDFYLHTGKQKDQYIRRWIKIIKACPTTKFYAYTRSWRIPELVPALRALARLPNMQLWLSCDGEAHKPIKIAGTRIAYLLARPGDQEKIPARANLLFRAIDRHEVRKKIDGIQVCPVEDGVQRTTQLTCTSCRLCWDSSPAILTQLSLPSTAPRK